MEEIFKLGKHEFATREEWEGAQRDLEMIQAILKRIDMENPEDLENIYYLVREGKIKFESKLGTAFFCDISDRVAQNLRDQLVDSEIQWEMAQRKQQKLQRLQEAKEQEEGEQQKQKETQQSIMFQILGIACALLSIACIAFYMHSVYREQKAVRKLEEVQQEKNKSQALDWYAGRNQEETEETENTEQNVLEVLPEYASLHAEYPDLAGWIRIEDTQIDMPVMQTSNNDYYLHYNIDGEEDVNGTLFIDCRNDFTKPDDNLIIYGHNMKSGAMFGGLKLYLNKEYMLLHDIIQFDTIYEKQIYQIIAVCLSEVGYQDETAYRYYNFTKAESEEDFFKFLDHVRSCAVLDRTQDVSAEDELLTLSTCNNYVEDGRLFVVAKKIAVDQMP